MKIEITKFLKICQLHRNITFKIIEAQVPTEFSINHHKNIRHPKKEKPNAKHTYRCVSFFNSPISGGMASCSLFHLRFLRSTIRSMENETIIILFIINQVKLGITTVGY